ncbi:sulfate transporter CysZ [Granulosicoccus sp. 3-233]|uniref:sulfate transporter CysZ n=1 Tax=Granulosicoccus sp. 3-233 TaxID=3417969 RepID=UPI003D333B0A
MKPIGPTQAFGYIVTGWRLMRTPGLRRFVWMPLLINVLVFGVLGWSLYSSANDWLHSRAFLSALPDWWIIHAIDTLLRWILGLVMFVAMAFLFTLLANLIGAPFNGLLAERVEAHLTGRKITTDPSWLTMARSVPRLMASELSKLLYLLLCLLPLLLLQFIPVINLVAPLLMFLFGAWMFALEYLDYPLGNHGALFRDVRAVARQRRRMALGFGSAVALLSAVPIVNLFVMPAAVAGATALYVDHLRSLYPLTPAAGDQPATSGNITHV